MSACASSLAFFVLVLGGILGSRLCRRRLALRPALRPVPVVSFPAATRPTPFDASRSETDIFRFPRAAIRLRDGGRRPPR